MYYIYWKVWILSSKKECQHVIGVNHLHIDPILVSDKKQSNHKLWQVCDSKITEKQKGSFSFSASTIYMGSGLVSLLLFLIGFDVPYKIPITFRSSRTSCYS